MAAVHHSAILSTDVEQSLRFWRDGLGFVVLMDEVFAGPWPTLFDGPTERLRAIFLGDPSRSDAGIVELVSFVDEEGEPVVTQPADASPTGSAFFLLSVVTDLTATLQRLRELGLDVDPRVAEVAGIAMAAIRDPDGVRVELVDDGGAANLDRLAGGSEP